MQERLLPHMLCSLPMKILLHGQRSTSVKPAFHIGNGAKAISRAGREVFAVATHDKTLTTNILTVAGLCRSPS